MLVEDEQSAGVLGSRLKRIEKCKDVINLKNALHHKNKPDHTRQIRELLSVYGACPAIELFSVDDTIPNVETFVKNFLYRKAVTNSFENARLILKDDRLNIITEVYALDGNVLKRDGSIISYSSPDLDKEDTPYDENA